MCCMLKSVTVDIHSWPFQAPEFDDKGSPASTPLPANELAPPPSAEELFG